LLHELGGKILVIGLPWRGSMTFVHYVEEMKDVDYRFHKRFAGEYIDGDGERSVRDYFLFVRDMEAGVQTFVDDAEAHCSALGINRVVDAFRTRLSIADAPSLYDELSRQLDRDPSFLHRIELP
jgi:aminoglycoside 3-N-acetyltransferase